ncbi:MAG: head GIN domain-containing protein [Salibacteraceae bacterium]
MKIATTLLLLISIQLNALSQFIVGSGNVTEITRSFMGIKALEVTGHIIVEIKVGNTEGIKIIADDNLHEYLISEFTNGTLKLSVTKNKRFRNVESRKVIVTVKSIESITNSGSGDIYSKAQFTGDLITINSDGSGDITLAPECKKVTLELSGSGEINLSGKTTQLSITHSGSGDVRAFDLIAHNVDVNCSGNGNVQVSPLIALSGTSNGNADIMYKGHITPTIETSGSSEVIQK